MITRLDGYVGRMLATLKELGLAENTLVIFTSDNGPHDESNHDLARFHPSGPLSRHQAQPDRRRHPRADDRPVAGHDPARRGDRPRRRTSATGWPPPPNSPAAKVPDGCDSISFVPTLLGQPREQRQHEFLYWEFHEGGFKQAALYQGRWKGIRSGGPDAPVVLYDLQRRHRREDRRRRRASRDRREDRRVSEDGPHRLRRLAARVEIAPPITSEGRRRDRRGPRRRSSCGGCHRT